MVIGVPIRKGYTKKGKGLRKKNSGEGKETRKGTFRMATTKRVKIGLRSLRADNFQQAEKKERSRGKLQGEKRDGALNHLLKRPGQVRVASWARGSFSSKGK